MSLIVWNVDGPLTQDKYRDRLMLINSICQTYQKVQGLPDITLVQNIRTRETDVIFKRYFPDSNDHPETHTNAAIYCKPGLDVKYIDVLETAKKSPFSKERNKILDVDDTVIRHMECCIVNRSILVVSWLGYEGAMAMIQNSRFNQMMKVVSKLQIILSCNIVVIGGTFFMNKDDCKVEKGVHALINDENMGVIVKGLHDIAGIEIQPIDVFDSQPLKPTFHKNASRFKDLLKTIKPLDQKKSMSEPCLSCTVRKKPFDAATSFAKLDLREDTSESEQETSDDDDDENQISGAMRHLVELYNRYDPEKFVRKLSKNAKIKTLFDRFPKVVQEFETNIVKDPSQHSLVALIHTIITMAEKGDIEYSCLEYVWDDIRHIV